ncbi:MAG: AsnC family transcriptional regulator [Promethearchaeota archaeon]
MEGHIHIDVTDTLLIRHLGVNCRQSYQILARWLGLTVNAIKNRVGKLLEVGAIGLFTLEL